MRFTQHYAGNAVCAPSRCVLMTGKHPGHAIVRTNLSTPPEGQHPLPEGTMTLARLLHALGYATGAFGKWGLGGPGSSGVPDKQGFDRFFGYLCQGRAHNSYPPSLWENDRKVPLKNPAIKLPAKLPKVAGSRQEIGHDWRPTAMSDMQREALTVLAELWALSPEVRLGQLMAHLGFLGEAHVGKGLGYIEDDELIAVLYRHRGELRGRGSSFFPVRIVSTVSFEQTQVQPFRQRVRGSADVSSLEAWPEFDQSFGANCLQLGSLT